MEEIIKKIIKIEGQAQTIIDDALADKRVKEEEHRERIENLEHKIVSDAKRKVQQIREREFVEIDGKENEKINNCNKHLDKMTKQAEENMDKWVRELVQRVIS